MQVKKLKHFKIDFEFQIKNFKFRRIVLIAVILLSVLGPTVYFTLVHPGRAAAAWFNASWAFRKAINIANSSGGALANFQVSFTVDTTDTTKFQSDCDDIRVTDANGKLLPHWVEESGTNACGTATTKVWVKVPSLPVSGQTIYLYYGNPSATNAASGDNVFEFFDTFNGNSVDSSQWTFSGSPTLTGGAVSLSNQTSLTSRTSPTDSSGLGNLIFRAKQAATTLTGGKIGFSNSSTNTHYNTDDSATLTVGSTEEQVSQTASTNLVSHHQLEETTTTDANQFKASGYLDTGKLSQAVSMYGNAAGTLGSTLTFNRGSLISGNNYEHINTNQGTFSFWVKSPTAIASIVYDQYLFDFGDAAGNRIALYMDASEDDLTLNINGTETSSAGITFAASTYYLITVLYNFTTDSYTVYQNGASVISSSTSLTAPTAPSTNFIGSNYSGLLQAQALIDDFAIYDRVLTTAEIATLYGNGTTTMVEAGSVADPSLKFYAKMDGTGTLSPVTYNGSATADQKAYNSSTNTNGQMVADWNMETAGTANWTADGTYVAAGATLTKITSGVFADTQSLQIDTNDTNQGTRALVTAAASSNYTLSFWCKGNQTIFPRIRSLPDNVAIISTNTDCATAWGVKEYVFKTTASTTQVALEFANSGTTTYYLDNVTLTPNSFNNGGLEGTYVDGVAPNWVTYGGTGTYEDSADAHSGSHAQKITHITGAGCSIRQDLTLDSNTSYLVSFWAKRTSGASVALNIESGPTISVTSSSWTKYSGVFKPTSSGSKAIITRVDNTSVGYFDDLSITPLDNTALSFKAWTPVNDTPGTSATELLSNTGFETAGGGGADIWGSWTENAGNGAIADESSIVNNGSHAAKLTGGAAPTSTPQIAQYITVVPEKSYVLTFYTRGDTTNAGRFNVFDWTHLVTISGVTATGVSGTSYQKVTYYFTAPVGTTSIQIVFYCPNINGGYAYFDDSSVKETNNPLSIHGDSDGVASNATGARGNGYTFDGSTGYLRQKTYATNVSDLSYLGNDTTTAELSDTGQTFTTYQTASGTAYAYMIVVTNSDNTTSWGYLGASDTANHINVHTAKGSATRGWNGTAPVAGTKTPVGYEIRKTDYQITGNLTVGAWVKRSSAGTHMILTKYNYMEDGTTQCSYGLLWRSENTIQLYANDAYNGADAISTTATIASDGTWHYVVGVIDSTNTDAHIYIDGSLSTENTSWNSSIYDSSIPLVVGARYYLGSPANWFSGSIDSPFVIASALTADQIKDIYNSTASHYGIVTNNATVNTSPANSSTPTTDANTYHTYSLSASSASSVLSQDGTTFSTSTTNLPNSAMYVRLQNADAANTLTVDWLAVTKYAATTPSAVVSATEEQSQGPAAYWKFDEGQGSTANDSSGRNNNGSLGTGSSAPTWQTEDMCVSGKCLKFDGTDDHVDSNDNIKPTSGITISAWINPSRLDQQQSLVERTLGFGIRLTATNKLTALLDTEDDSWNLVATSNKSISKNTWTHVVMTYTSGSNIVYINGVQDGSNTSYTGNLSYTDGAETWVGGWSWSGGGGYFQGFIDEVKIYPYARSQAQILADYNSGKAKASSSEGIAAQLGTNDQSLDALSNGLVGYWKMDEGSWAGSANEVIDSSGNGNHGVGVGATAPPTTAAGKFGNGGSFDGTDQYLNVGNNSTIKPITSFTASGWIKPTSFATYGRYIISEGMTCNSPNRMWEIYTSATTGLLTLYWSNDGSAVLQSASTGGLTAGAWQHITVTFNNGEVKFYINGVLDSTDSTNKGKNIFLNTSNVRLGYGYCGTSDANIRPLNGSLDDVRVYNRALSPAEVSQLYNWAPGPVAQYTFDEGSGGTVNDISGNNNVGAWAGTGATHWTEGKIGKAGKFNGSDDYVSLANTISFASPTTWTIEGWFKRTGDSSSIQTLINYDYDNNSFGLGLNGDSLTWESGTSGWGRVAGPTMPTAWTYITAIFSGVSGNWSVSWYLNGIFQSTTTSAVAFSTPQIRYFGGPGAGGGAVIDMDDLRFYNYARSSKQIVEDMNVGHPAVGSPVGSAVGYWKFDEGFGTNANNSGNGGLALNGTLGTGSSAPAWTNDGKFGKALSFDGSNDYVSVADNSALKNFTNMSVSLWFNATNWTNQQVLIGKDGNSGWYWEYTSTLNFYVLGANKGSVGSVATGAWHHLVATYDGTATNTYLDGVKKTGGSLTGTMPSSTGALFIGAYSAGTYRHTGLIDEVKIYNYALTEDDVKAEYNHGSAMVLGSLSDTSGLSGGSVASQSASAEYCIPGDTATCSAPVGRWDFEEGTGGTVNDKSGNGNTGTWYGTGTTHWSAGKIGKAGNFNGSNDYVNVTNPANGTLNFGTGSFTVSLWTKFNTTNANRVITKGEWAEQGFVTSLGCTGNNKMYFSLYDGSNRYYICTVDSVSTNQWDYWTFVANQRTSLAIYKNGQPVSVNGVGTLSSVGTITTTRDLVMGMIPPTSNGFSGSIDDVRIYNYARTPAQIAWDYNRGKPVAQYKFDECSGTVANDSIGANTGSINIGATGTNTSAGTCTGSAGEAWKDGVNGKYNSSLEFDGVDDYVDAGTSSIFNITDQITVSAWVKTTTKDKHVVGRGLSGSADHTFLLATTNDHNNFVFADGYSFNAADVVEGNKTITDGNWHHLVGTFTGSTINVYTDGVLDNSKNKSTKPTSNTSIKVTIGKLLGYDSSLFTGQIDDVQIYNYALTAQQVKALYNQNSSVRFGPVSGIPD